ncbi:MAG: primosomal protein N' [Chloroflexi bacterium]|jgi:primosomal protein N' (replication factor Y)|nr:primosomal protein N' [Chloroflexota bacterium]
MPDQVERPANNQTPLYAVVVVHTALHHNKIIAAADQDDDLAEEVDYLTRAFHYNVPDALRPQVAAGQLVWVPFGRRYLQGIIVRLDDCSPVEETRDLDAIVDPQPVLSPLQIELAHWISEYYLAPIHQVILSMLPPGVTQKVEVVLRPVDDVSLEQATDKQQEILTLLRQEKALTLQQLSRLTRQRGYRSTVEQLLKHGWITKRPEIRPPQVRPKLVTVVRAAANADPNALGDRAIKQQQALRYLLAQRDEEAGWLPLSVAAAEAGVAAAQIRALADKGLVELEERQVWRDPLEGREFVPIIRPRLTLAQEEVWKVIAADLDAPGGRPFLLQGVTGSGKTEIYLRAVQRVLAQGRSAIVLIPEISLTAQTIRRFGARFPTEIAVMHSRLSPGERYDQWRRLRAGELRLVVGSRSALFAPVRNVGLIVLDEEHEWSYKQEKTPRYHAREVAIRMARLAGATCILGSATPDLESSYRAERGEYVRLRMPQRIMGHRRALEEQAAHLCQPQTRYQPISPDMEEALTAELPPVQIVDMRAELRQGNTSIFSRSLQKAIEEALAAGEQVILFLNRRGSATFVQCRDCGYVHKCPRCDLPLTFHSVGDDLVCHHCNYHTVVPPQCPSCGSGRIKYFGIGTQRVEEVTRECFPQARVVRWDLDTTGAKLSHEQILDQFIQGEADIMVGTQMIAKGLDLPKVTLVGVITADTMINLPDFRAGERAFQLLTQVAGRAGRSILGGRVIIQSYTPEHPAIQSASLHDYDGFYAREIAFRREHWYPPISRLVQLLYVHHSEAKARESAQELYALLTNKIVREGWPDVDLIGPAPAFFARLRNKWRWQIVVRGYEPQLLLRDIRLPFGWRVDVDPVMLL